MNWISKYVAVWQSRIALGIVFFGAIISGLWPDHARTIDPAKLTICITAGLAWLVAELASAATKVSNHDIALFERITNVMDDDALTFLLDHDFSHDLHSNQTRPVSTIAEWHGPNFIFNDAVIHRRWQVIFDKIVHLSHLYGKTLVGTDRENILTAWLLGYNRHNQPAHAHAEVAALNVAASTLYREFGDFVIFVRQRLDL